MASVSQEQVIEKLKQIFDPEVPVDIYNFGLIYKIEISDKNDVQIAMTLTSEACPVAQQLPLDAQKKVEEIEAVRSCKVDVVWEPRWTPEKITAEGRAMLGPEDEGEDDSW